MTSASSSDTTDPGSRPTYPAAPWTAMGQLWVSLFRLRDGVDELRPAGVYGAAFVSYGPGSDLTYSELLVARPAKSARPRAPGQHHRHLGGLPRVGRGRPRALGDPEGTLRLHPGERPHRSGVTHRLVGLRWIGDRSRAPRSPTCRERRRGSPSRAGPGSPASTTPTVRSGRPACAAPSKTLPCRGRWEFASDGPLGWLSGARQLASFRMAGFRMSFG